LDVGIFGPLRHYYAAEVNVACSHLLGVNISKADFIALYDSARMLGFGVNNVVNVWKGSRMYPVNPEKVLSKLPPERSVTPEQSQDIPYDKTPRSARDLHTSMEQVLRQWQLTPASRTRIQKGMKGSKDAMLQNVFLEQENEALRESIKLLQRRKGPGRRIKGVGRVISSHEASQASQASQNVEKAVTKASKRAPRAPGKPNSTMEVALRPFCHEFQI